MTGLVWRAALAGMLAAMPAVSGAQEDPAEIVRDLREVLRENPADEAAPAPQDATPGVQAPAAEDAEADTAPEAEPGADPAGETETAETPPQPLPTVEEIEAASYDGAPLPDGRSALTVKVQVLLDRAAISPGVIDGWRGGMSESAIRAFERREGLPVDGELDAEVWSRLGGPMAGQIMTTYTITAEDVAATVAPLPSDYSELAERDWLGYERVSELVAERFHMAESFLTAMNPDTDWSAGDVVTVADPGPDLSARIGYIQVDKTARRIIVFDRDREILTSYPVTVGSSSLPSPTGVVAINAIAREPTYHYNPENFVQGDNMQPLTLPPGPNGPVGLVWIDLSKPSYGLHGTPNPNGLYTNASHGCVRLTNWDAMELAGIAEEGVIVEFVE